MPIKPIIFKSSNQNDYLYLPRQNKILYIHPLVAFFIENNKKAAPLRPEVESFSSQEIQYYYKKYMEIDQSFIQKERDDQGKDDRHFLSARLDATTVEQAIANIRQITFEVTDDCNLKCKYCGYGEFYSDYDERKKQKLDFWKAKTLLKYLIAKWNSPLNRSLQMPVYVSFYGGEPLLNISFIKQVVTFINTQQIKNNSIIFSMTTNGLLLDKHIDFLSKHDFRLLISLDGDESGNGYRVSHNGQPAFRRILNNIEIIQSCYPDYFKKRINFNAVLHRKNSTAAILDFFRCKFNKVPTISSLNTSGISGESKEEFINTYKNFSEDLMTDPDFERLERELFINSPTLRGLSSFLMDHSGHYYDNYNDFLREQKRPIQYPSGTCIPFSKKMYLTVNGKILPCERIGHQYALGTVTAHGVILDGASVAAKYNSYFDQLTKQCLQCYKRETCGYCLFYLEYRDGKIRCDKFFGQKKFSKFLSIHVSRLENDPALYRQLKENVVIDA